MVARFAGLEVRDVGYYGGARGATGGFLAAVSEEPGIRIVARADHSKVDAYPPPNCYHHHLFTTTLGANRVLIPS